jgi:hypothetical protein
MRARLKVDNNPIMKDNAGCGMAGGVVYAAAEVC